MVRSHHLNQGKVANSLDDPYNLLVEKFKKGNPDYAQYQDTLSDLGFLSVLNPFDDRASVAEKKMRQKFLNFLRKELTNNE